MTLVERIAAAHSVDCHAIIEARTLSDQRIRSGREALQQHKDGVNDIVAFGSLARREATSQSDFDYLLVSTGLPPEDTVQMLLSKADSLRREWAIKEGRSDESVPPPGATGLFGTAVSAFGVIDRIGLQEDTNHSLTRRMLFIEESTSLLDQDVHEEVIRAALERYLHFAGDSPDRPPRFLLNDVLRYWHTVAVDYQAKARVNRHESGLRYLKLVISRKLLYAGSLMTILSCGKDFGHKATVDELFRVSQQPSFDRLLAPYDHAPHPVQEAMATLVHCQNHFLTWSNDPAWRSAVKGSASQDVSSSSLEPDVAKMPAATQLIHDAKELAAQLQKALEVIFFEWEELSIDARKLLAF